MTREKLWTPGPWGLVGYDYFEEGHLVGVSANDDTGRYYAVAAIKNQSEKTEANAHLIAAAPDLVEALELALQDPMQLWPGHPNREFCENALAKAYGDTPTGETYGETEEG